MAVVLPNVLLMVAATTMRMMRMLRATRMKRE
jgi:hypothetical protein